MLDWDDLRYLLAVHRTGSLIGAGRALSVDKATVSRRIAALELALGVRLFDRKPKGYQLTPHGQRVVATVGEVDQTIAALTSELSEARGDATGRVFLSIPQWFASHVLVAAVPAFRARHPGIDLVVNASSSVLNVAQREVEVGLRNLKPDQASVTARRVGALGSALYGARDYLKRRGTPATPAALAHHDLVGWDRAVTFVTGFAWLAETGARVVFRGNDAQVLCDAVAAGLGLAVLPVLLGDERAGLVRLETFGQQREEIWAVAPSELRRSLRVRAVVDLIAGAFSANRHRLAGRSVDAKG